MAIFTLRGCVIPIRATWNKRGSLGDFPPKRLHDYIDNHMGQKGNLRCSFVLNIFKKQLRYGYFPIAPQLIYIGPVGCVTYTFGYKVAVLWSHPLPSWGINLHAKNHHLGWFREW